MSTWVSLTPNQTVSRTALQDAVTHGVFTNAAGVPSTNTSKMCTKSEVASYINFNPIGNYASKSSNQLVAAGDLGTFTRSCGSTSYVGLDGDTNVLADSYAGNYYINTVSTSIPINLGTTSGTVTVSGTIDLANYFSPTTGFRVGVLYNGVSFESTTLTATGSFSYTFTYTYSSSAGTTAYLYITAT